MLSRCHVYLGLLELLCSVIAIDLLQNKRERMQKANVRHGKMGNILGRRELSYYRVLEGHLGEVESLASYAMLMEK